MEELKESPLVPSVTTSQSPLSLSMVAATTVADDPRKGQQDKTHQSKYDHDNGYATEDEPIKSENESTIHKKTMRRLQHWESGSKLLNQQLDQSHTTKSPVPHISTKDIVIDDPIAQGCFGVVYAVKSIRCLEDAKPNQLVLKRARRIVEQDKENDGRLKKKQNMCFLDLACEANFLKHLPAHPHIIRLRAILGHPGTYEYGLLFDKLAHTLAELVDRHWRDEYPSCIGGKRLGWWRNSVRVRTFYFQRVQIIAQLASALMHLHHYSIVYRDLKPPNIGFKQHDNMLGELQLFDFGCAKELKVRQLIEQPDGYCATPMTGTIGYMAPEVMLGLPYGVSADVYSFSMLMWYVFSLQKPIDHNQACTQTTVQDIVYRHKRPRALPVLSESLQQLMEQCWNRDRLQRPKSSEIVRILEAECKSKHSDLEIGQ